MWSLFMCLAIIFIMVTASCGYGIIICNFPGNFQQANSMEKLAGIVSLAVAKKGGKIRYSHMMLHWMNTLLKNTFSYRYCSHKSRITSNTKEYLYGYDGQLVHCKVFMWLAALSFFTAESGQQLTGAVKEELCFIFTSGPLQASRDQK